MLNKRSAKLIEYFLDKGKEKVSEDLFDELEKNRILFYVSQKNGLGKVEEVGLVWIDKLKETLLFIKKKLPSNYYLITRTYKYMPYVTFDVDLFVPEKHFNEVVKMFKENGCEIKSHDSSLGGRLPGRQVNVVKKGLLTIDMHKDFTWQKRRFFDIDLMDKGTRSREIAGVEVNIPSAEVELLLCIADISHERFNITLADVVWVKGLSEEIKDWSVVFDQIKKYEWMGVFKMVAEILNGLAKDIYKLKLIPDVGVGESVYNLPYFLPLNVCWLSYLENFKSNKHFPATSFAYMHYCKLRYILSGEKKMPFYDNWYNAR